MDVYTFTEKREPDFDKLKKKTVNALLNAGCE